MAPPAVPGLPPGQEAAMMASWWSANIAGFASAGTALFSAAQSVVSNAVAQAGQAIQTVAFIMQTFLAAAGQELNSTKQGMQSMGHGIVERSVA